MCSIDESNEWEYTHNIPPRVCSVAEQKRGLKSVLVGRRQRQTEQFDRFPPKEGRLRRARREG